MGTADKLAIKRVSESIKLKYSVNNLISGLSTTSTLVLVICGYSFASRYHLLVYTHLVILVI